jgi:hypothetical protein
MANELAQNDPAAMFLSEDKKPVTQRQKTWLDRMSFLTPTSKAVTTDLARSKQFQFGKDTFLPEEVVVFILARRQHAIWLRNNKPHMESFDDSEEEYGLIAQAQEETRHDKKQSAMVGEDFLVYVPQLNEFAYFHVAKSALDNVVQWDTARPGKANYGPQILDSEPKSNADHNWRIPRVTLAPDAEVVGTYTQEQAAHALNLFQNPTPQGREEAKAKPKKGGRKARSK